MTTHCSDYVHICLVSRASIWAWVWRYRVCAWVRKCVPAVLTVGIAFDWLVLIILFVIVINSITIPFKVGSSSGFFRTILLLILLSFTGKRSRRPIPAAAYSFCGLRDVSIPRSFEITKIKVEIIGGLFIWLRSIIWILVPNATWVMPELVASVSCISFLLLLLFCLPWSQILLPNWLLLILLIIFILFAPIFFWELLVLFILVFKVILLLQSIIGVHKIFVVDPQAELLPMLVESEHMGADMQIEAEDLPQRHLFVD